MTPLPIASNKNRNMSKITYSWKDPKTISRYLEQRDQPLSLGSDCSRMRQPRRTGACLSNATMAIAAAIQLRGVVKRMFDYAIEIQFVAINSASMVATRHIGKSRKRTRSLCRHFACGVAVVDAYLGGNPVVAALSWISCSARVYAT